MHKIMISSRKTKNNILWLLGYYFILCLIYVFWLSPIYDYWGFKVSYTITGLLIGLFLASFVSIYVAELIERDGISDTMIVMMTLLYFYPQIVLFVFNLNNSKYLLYVMLYLIGLFLANQYLPISDNKLRIKGRANLFEVVIILLGILMVIISGAFSGFRVSFNLSDYYEYRFEVREMVMPTLIKYILNWARTLLPIGLAYALIKKKNWLIIFTIIAQVLCFSFDGKKSSLFMFLLAFAVATLFKSSYRKKMPIYMCVFGASIFVESALRSGKSFIGNIIIRRLMFVPSYLGWAYYDFFSNNELDYLKSSILRWVGFKSTYSEAIPRIIGKEYYLSSSSAVNANTGLCGDAFSNFGWWSLLLYPIFDVIIFKIIAKYTEGLDERLQIIISLTVVYTFINGSFFSVLLTNGVLLLIILLILLPKKDLISHKSQRK